MSRPHILVQGQITPEPHRQRDVRQSLPHDVRQSLLHPAGSPSPAVDRAAHGALLGKAFEAAVTEAAARRKAAGMVVRGATPGLYLQVEGRPGTALDLAALSDPQRGIELVSVTAEKAAAGRVERAALLVPDSAAPHLASRIQEYAGGSGGALLDGIATVRLATLRSLWTDPADSFPDSGEIWWEVWLRRRDNLEVQRLLAFATRRRLDVGDRCLLFDDRTVMLVLATERELAASIDVLADIAELRRAKETAAVFAAMEAGQHAERLHELLARTGHLTADAPAVCVLDTGVNRGHPLIEEALAAEDRHSCDASWGPHDHHGHGTKMAGLALHGDLTAALAGAGTLPLRHGLESVKILPPRPASLADLEGRPELYGAITGLATALVEAQAPARQRCFSMAITAPDEGDRGQPTSWSAAIDALAAGNVFDAASNSLGPRPGAGEPRRRLFVLSAGNVHPDALQSAHLDRCDADPVQDPAQAWNALTVGAFTEKAEIRDPEWSGWQPVAAAGDLSPWSPTSVPFEPEWPNKPDIVLEGGNVVKNERGEVSFACADLCLLSTHYQPERRPFVLSWATSAATALAARIAAIVAAEHPNLWPETLRALIVHSARWTPAMRAHFEAAKTREDRARLLRRYGFGVPDVERALGSSEDAPVLVVQASLRPFAGGAGERHLHELPWPREELRRMGDREVRVRATLSYFIEPNPARRGFAGRSGYASHGLRFELKGATESLADLRARLDGAADAPPSGDWYLGEEARNRGSIHSDILHGRAADIAERGAVAVYPVAGWWQDQPEPARSERAARYALVVSIEVPRPPAVSNGRTDPGEGAALWTAIAAGSGKA